MFKTQGLQPKVAGLIHEPTVNFLVVFYNCKEGRDLTMRVDQATFHFLLWRQSGHEDLYTTWRRSDHSYLNLLHNSLSKIFWPVDYKALLADWTTCPTQPLQMIQNTTHTSLLFVSFHWQPISGQDTDNYTKKSSQFHNSISISLSSQFYSKQIL